MVYFNSLTTIVFPVFLEQPTAVSQLVLEVAQLVCKARASPLPVITWFRNGVQIQQDNSEGVSIISLQGESVVSSVLTIHSLSVDVAGTYYCNATNNLVTERSVLSEEALVTALCEYAYTYTMFVHSSVLCYTTSS